MTAVRRPLAVLLAAVLGFVLSLIPLTAVSTAHADPLPQPREAAVEANGDSIVHLFQWRWDSVAEECETTLGPNGWGGVQVSPPQEHVVLPAAEGGTYPWWQDYQPVSYKIDQTRRGDRAAFVDMVERCRDSGVKIYVDMVLNHMSGTGSVGAGPGSAGTVFEKYSYPDLFGDGSGDSYTRADFGPCYREITNWNDKAEVQNCELLSLADLNTADADVRRMIAKYMNTVIDLGVAGFRVDAAKHVQEAHLADIIDRLHDVPGFGGRPDLFHEVYGDATVPYTAYAPYGGVTNFDYQRAVASAFSDGTIASLGAMPDYGGLTSAQAVVFIDNHDTQRATPTLTYKDGDRYYLADAFMMAHPYGTPQLMSSYAFGSVEAEGPPSSTNGTTNATDCDSAAWICEHRNEQVLGMAGFRNATDGHGIGSVTTDGNGRLGFARGTAGYAAFNATSSVWDKTFTTGLPDGDYCNVARGTYDAEADACTGGVLTVSDGAFTAAIPANRGVALHIEALTECLDPGGCGPVGPPPGGGSTSFTADVTTDYGQEVYAVGSVPELGSWNPRDGLKLSTDEATYPTWTGSADIDGPFAWKLVKVSPGGTAEWENDPNRSGTGGASYNVTWNVAAGGSGGGGGSGCSAVTARFHPTVTTWHGQEVYVVGSVAQLGNWDPGKAVKLSSADYPLWKGTVSLPGGTSFTYKYVKKNPDGTVEWEQRGNRFATADDSGGGCSRTFADNWG
ncbi:carbohydrate-binding module family 20 domain-containing protein [Nocardiopsis ansamitocini]|uniref:Alpha-amylase n=1 Tax=Nocardiopsis ansamitocini TaxID=1670832 RepID=A0A9W6P2P1_9ACTN|nr:carbohydrate-binding module family 20 domain-containing protein [Nocardiopsis ansamitocini]GLU46125.1 alpha-amylase [Nocardiopsis ansamitocini]